jgi:hypothetical protein
MVHVVPSHSQVSLRGGQGQDPAGVPPKSTVRPLPGSRTIEDTVRGLGDVAGDSLVQAFAANFQVSVPQNPTIPPPGFDARAIPIGGNNVGATWAHELPFQAQVRLPS